MVADDGLQGGIHAARADDPAGSSVRQAPPPQSPPPAASKPPSIAGKALVLLLGLVVGVAHRCEVFAELYNPDPQTYVVDKAGFTMGVLGAGGNLTVYGLKVP